MLYYNYYNSTVVEIFKLFVALLKTYLLAQCVQLIITDVSFNQEIFFFYQHLTILLFNYNRVRFLLSCVVFSCM